MTQQKKKKRIEYYGGILNNELIDVVFHEGDLLFEVINETDITLKSEIILDDKILLPPVQVPWSVPPSITQEDINSYDPKNHMIKLKEHLHKYVELPQPEQYELLSLWIMATWAREIFPIYSYLHFKGPKSCGKSKALEAIAPACCRGVLTASPSEPTMFREISSKKVTYFLDDLEQEDIDKRNLLGLLDSGYRSDWLYSRCRKDDHAIVDYFSVGGFKAFSSRDDFKDVLESRCISITMRKTPRKVPLRVSKGDTYYLQKMGNILQTVIFKHACSDYAMTLAQENVTVKGMSSKGYAASQDVTVKDKGVNDKNSSKQTPYDAYIYNNNNNNNIYTVYNRQIDSIFVHTRIEEIYAYTTILASLLTQVLPDSGFEVSPDLTSTVTVMLQEKLSDEYLGDEASVLEAALEHYSSCGWEKPPSTTELCCILNREVSNPQDRWSDKKTIKLLKRVNFKRGRTGRRRFYQIRKDLFRKVLDDYHVEYSEELFSDAFAGSGVDGTLKPKEFDMSEGGVTKGVTKEKKKDNERSKSIRLLKVIAEIEKQSKEGVATFDEIRESMGVSEGELTELIKQERKGYDLYSPRTGVYKVTGR